MTLVENTVPTVRWILGCTKDLGQILLYREDKSTTHHLLRRALHGGDRCNPLYRLRKENPSKLFVPLREDAVCSYMKTITLQKVYKALRDDAHLVEVPANIAAKSRGAIERMVAVG